jgi:hypothetical protein
MELDVERSVNVRIDGREEQRLARQIEFIGPQMDIGFRVAKFSSSMNLVLALELALFVITARLEDVPAARGLRFHYEGRETLKGVSAEKPYPIVTLLIPGSNDYVELRLRGAAPYECVTVEDLTDLARLCREHLNANPPLFVPYLISCDTFNEIPPSHRALLQPDET